MDYVEFEHIVDTDNHPELVKKVKKNINRIQKLDPAYTVLPYGFIENKSSVLAFINKKDKTYINFVNIRGEIWVATGEFRKGRRFMDLRNIEDVLPKKIYKSIIKIGMCLEKMIRKRIYI